MPRNHSSCQIIRTAVVTTMRHDRETDQFVPVDRNTRTEPCDAPLFEIAETTSGVCRSCRTGWEVPDNRFADEEQKARALAAAV